ncbi:MAG: copper resistance protein B [Gallionella sp.]
MKLKQMKAIAQILSMLIITAIWVSSASAAGNMPGMDHSKMNHGSKTTADEIKGEGHVAHGEQGAMRMQGGTAPDDARDPHAYSGGYDFGPIPPPKMADVAYMGGLMINRLERSRSNDTSFNAYDMQGWFGKDYERLVLKAEGEMVDGKLNEARTELLWGSAMTAYWDTQLGVRNDGGVEPSRTWLAFGVQGLAPYWFEMEVTAYAGDNGMAALRVSAEYELLITQKLILQPRAEINLYSKSDPVRDIGSGLSDTLAGLRLRYEYTREFAPYVGIEWAGKFGGTADFARSSGEQTSETQMVTGVRFWF